MSLAASSTFSVAAGTNRREATADVVGNKGANLIRMAKAGLPVPPGFVLPTSLCWSYFLSGQQLPEGTGELLHAGIREVEKVTGLCFGGDRRPLLLAVRSGVQFLGIV